MLSFHCADSGQLLAAATALSSALAQGKSSEELARLAAFLLWWGTHWPFSRSSPSIAVSLLNGSMTQIVLDLVHTLHRHLISFRPQQAQLLRVPLNPPHSQG